MNKRQSEFELLVAEKEKEWETRYPVRLSNLTQVVDNVYARYAAAVDLTEAKITVSAFSGGHDSILMQYFAEQHPLYKGAMFANTLTGSIDTIDFVRSYFADKPYAFYEGYPTTVTYIMWVVKYGFPSPVTHSHIYRYVKDRAFTKIEQDIRREHNIKSYELVTVTGLRRYESRKRMSSVSSVRARWTKQGKNPNKILASPLYDFTQTMRDNLIQHLNLPINPFAKTMGHSYECGCGANLERDEKAKLAIVNPIMAERIRLQEAVVKAAYELQKYEVETGLVPREQAHLDSERLEWGWHVNKPISVDELRDSGDEFNLCQSCMTKRAPDGTAGIDIDEELLKVRNDLLDI